MQNRLCCEGREPNTWFHRVSLQAPAKHAALQKLAAWLGGRRDGGPTTLAPVPACGRRCRNAVRRLVQVLLLVGGDGHIALGVCDASADAQENHLSTTQTAATNKFRLTNERRTNKVGEGKHNSRPESITAATVSQ